MLPDPAAQRWIESMLAWLERALAPRLALPRPLVLPNDAFFPVRADLAPEARSRALFAQLARRVGLAELRCEIAPLLSLEPASPGSPLVFVPCEPEPAALFERSLAPGAPHRIHYHPELHADPQRLLAILAHGLAHALLAELGVTPPGDEASYDCATDLAALWLGAGVFLANAALVVAREEGLFYEGLEVRCQGWLGRGDFAFALALFCRRFGHAPATASQHLRLGARLEFERASRALAADEGALAPHGTSLAVRER